MNPESLQEIRNWSATEIMGWERRKIEGVTCLQPTGVNVVWFTDNSNGGITWRTNTAKVDPRYDPPLWGPDIPKTGHIWMFLKRMGELEYYYTMNNHFYKGCKTEVFFHRNIPPTFEEQWLVQHHENPCIAILMAAMAYRVIKNFWIK